MCALTLTAIHVSQNLVKFGEKGPIEGNKGQKTKKTSLPRVKSVKGDRHAPRQGRKALKLYWVEISILFNPFIPESFTQKLVFEACELWALSILSELASQTSQVVKRIPVSKSLLSGQISLLIKLMVCSVVVTLTRRRHRICLHVQRTKINNLLSFSGGVF